MSSAGAKLPAPHAIELPVLQLGHHSAVLQSSFDLATVFRCGLPVGIELSLSSISAYNDLRRCQVSPRLTRLILIPLRV